jgi:hypothetical protein
MDIQEVMDLHIIDPWDYLDAAVARLIKCQPMAARYPNQVAGQLSLPCLLLAIPPCWQ